MPLKTLFDKYGVECIIPPRYSPHIISLAAQYSPEWVCFPYKFLLGCMIQGLEQGADTVIDIGGPGLCRLGYYAKLHEQTLRDMGYKFDMVVFNWQDGQITGLARFLRKLLGNDKPWRRIIGDIKLGLQQLMLMDDLERRVHRTRPREKEKGAASRLWRTAGDRISAAHTQEALKTVKRELLTELAAVPLDPEARPLKVGLGGEWYVAVEPACNLDLEEQMGNLGVEVVRSAFLTDWVKVWLFLELVGLSHGKKVKKAASPYLSREVSGDAIQSLGETVLHHKEGFDGIIHVEPFTCMPEITARNILPKVVQDHHIPVLSLILDEQTGRAGMLSRVEAFVDLMKRRRLIQRRRC
ncbi:MAG: CoA protein activase [Chloroflexota bacterium]|nr:CoA protein activase [Chloroflexota bacterium]